MIRAWCLSSWIYLAEVIWVLIWWIEIVVGILGTGGSWPFELVGSAGEGLRRM